MHRSSLAFLCVCSGMVLAAACGGGAGLGTNGNQNVNDNQNQNQNQGGNDAGPGTDGQVSPDSGPGPDGSAGCLPGTDPCCDPDGTACDHGCDGTDCYPECDPGADACCNPDGTLSGGGHDVCELGGPLDAACDACVAAVCQTDAYCCNTEWDLMCFDAVLTECSVDCSAGVVSCDDQYGGMYPYTGCAQGGGTCTFGTSTYAGSCATLCANRGGECVDAYNNDNTACGLAEQTGCGHTGYASEICICSRGCGANAPCTSPATCQNGQCL